MADTGCEWSISVGTKPFYTISKLHGCARCGGEHDNIEFKAFSRPSVLKGIRVVGWAPCPLNGEPIFISVVKKSTTKRIILWIRQRLSRLAIQSQKQPSS